MEERIADSSNVFLRPNDEDDHDDGDDNDVGGKRMTMMMVARMTMMMVEMIMMVARG